MSDYKYSIEAKNVNKVFYKKSRQVKALIDFNIKIENGTIHGLLGPSKPCMLPFSIFILKSINAGICLDFL